ncbi:MAG: BMP family ABC transporter substrate-binding protein, partial [Eubacteriales bacterium]
EQESGFYAGMAAALESETKKVAVVNGIAYPSNVNYQYGFESGVNYANAKYDTGVEFVELPSYAGTDVTNTNVAGNYVGTFDDLETGKVVGEALIAQGVDIMFVAAGGSGIGVFTAAKEHASAMIVGCDVDQYDDGESGTRNVVLTTGLKIMDLNIYRQLNAIKDGTFTGGNVLLLADTDSTGFVSEDGRHQMSEDTVAKILEAEVLIKDGTIVPAANFNGIDSADFPGMDS